MLLYRHLIIRMVAYGGAVIIGSGIGITVSNPVVPVMICVGLLLMVDALVMAITWASD